MISLGILTKSRSHRVEYSGKALNSLMVLISPKFWAAADYIPSAGEWWRLIPPRFWAAADYNPSDGGWWTEA